MPRLSAVTDNPAPIAALLDGTLLGPGTPLLRPDDLGVLRGEGVFETTLVVDGQPRDLDEHLVRLAVSAEMTGLVLPAPAAWRRGVHALLRARTGDRQLVLRLVASRGPESATEPVCYVLAAAISPRTVRQRTEGVRVLLLDRGFSASAAQAAPWLLAGAKTLSYGVNMAALRYAAGHDADDVIFLGSDGAVLEAPTATVVIARDRTLLTPPPAGILDGDHRAPAVPGGRGGRLADRNRRPRRRRPLGRRRGVVGVQCAPARAGDVRSTAAPRSDGRLTAELARLLEVPVSP